MLWLSMVIVGNKIEFNLWYFLREKNKATIKKKFHVKNTEIIGQ